MGTHEMLLVPRDGFFFKDARGWYTSASGRTHGLAWPYPSSILGSIRTAYGKQAEAIANETWASQEWLKNTKAVKLEKMIAFRKNIASQWSVSHRMWPRPLDALIINSNIVKIKPRKPESDTTIMSDDNGIPAKALWFAGIEEKDKPDKIASWWTDDAFTGWLAGGIVDIGKIADSKELSPVKRVKTQVGINPDTYSTKEGVLFSTEVTETLSKVGKELLEWAIGISFHTPENTTSFENQIFLLGGVDYPANSLKAPDNAFAFPNDLNNAFSKGVRGLKVVLTTPAFFTEGWLPDGFGFSAGAYRGKLPGITGDCILKSAVIDRAQSVSGWDMVKGAPKAIKRLVPAGSVYFFEKSDGSTFTGNEANLLWLSQIGRLNDEGYGLVVPGVWNP
jgi:CRISPR-associated protein Cmr3